MPLVWVIMLIFAVMSAESPPPSFSTQNRSNGASHMGSRGPPAPPGGGGGAPAPAAARLGQSGGSTAGGGTSGGQEPTPMDMSLGPQPNQQMTASHGMPVSVPYIDFWEIKERSYHSSHLTSFQVLS